MLLSEPLLSLNHRMKNCTSTTFVHTIHTYLQGSSKRRLTTNSSALTHITSQCTASLLLLYDIMLYTHASNHYTQPSHTTPLHPYQPHHSPMHPLTHLQSPILPITHQTQHSEGQLHVSGVLEPQLIWVSAFAFLTLSSFLLSGLYPFCLHGYERQYKLARCAGSICKKSKGRI